jgi:beta-N-acetylhexosaminidase
MSAAGAAPRRLRRPLPSPLSVLRRERFHRGLLFAILLAAVAGAFASVVVQRAGDEPAAVPPSGVRPSPQVARLLGQMTPRQKVDAVMAAGGGAAGGALGAAVVSSEDWAGGPAAIERLGTPAARSPARPLVIGTQEGGVYRSYANLPTLATQLQIGDTADPKIAREQAAKKAAAMSAAGFDLNFGPLADVATIDSPVADRAYGDDPELVARLTAAALRGCKEGKIACAVSHFPGLGAASDDTAVSPATVGLDAASLASRDLVPFRAAFDAGAPAVVLSLAFYAAYDPVTPAALSPAIAGDLLRRELGFKGVAITDDLSSGAVAAGLGAPGAAVQALAAGADMVTISDSGQAAGARDAIRAAVASGAIPSIRLDDAAARVLELKRKLGLLKIR